MTRSCWLVSTCLVAIASPALAQDRALPPSSAGSSAAGAVHDERDADTIIITATRRASPLSDVPIAVSAITAETLQNSGATDIRQLNQVSPSLLVSSTSSEAGAGGARIRGIGTVGDNAGLESSVATFIDGVYRSRAGVALTELGPLERIEVLRGPQGTLFGRNASAGLINIVTARPRYDTEGYGEASYGNYDYYRLGAGLTGPLGKSGLAYRIDGVYAKRDGFLKDAVSGRDVNGRDRWLVRGKLLYEPSADLSVMLIGDYAKRNEECCASVYLPAHDVSRNADGTLSYGPSSVAALLRSLTSVVPGGGRGIVNDDPYARRTAITPGRDFRSDVRDWGGSGEIDYKIGEVSLTSITAYRNWKYVKGQDADYSNLDILARPGDGRGYTQFKTFSQELRLQGSLFRDKLDWLVGGYYAREKLDYVDNIQYGADYEQFSAARVRQLSPAFGALAPIFAAFPGFQNLKAFTTGLANAALPAATPGRAQIIQLLTNAVANAPLNGTGADDAFRQKDRNLAIFTHNIVHVTNRLSLTLGARYTDDKKTLDADYRSTSQCAGYVQSINNLKAIAAANPGLATLAGGYAQILQAAAGLPCVINSVNGTVAGKKKEGEWSGTAVLSYKPIDRLLGYVSYSRGYKAGGFNLDRAPLFNPASLVTNVNADVLKFQPEKVDAFEAGLKFNGRRFDINVAAFLQKFKSFQLNTFNGTAFFVTDIRGCKDDLGTTDSDLIAGNSACSKTKSGVTSKGVEVEAFLYPAPDVTFGAGFTLSDTRYAKNLSGTADASGNNSLIPALFLLPGGRLSNSSLYTVTGSGSWTPLVGRNLRALFYADFRYQSDLNTGSDLFWEKKQDGVMVVNARIGLSTENKRWSLEVWGQNLFNKNYEQVAFNAPIQGSNTSAAQTAAFGTTATQLYSAFLAEPRTYGLTVRTRF